jgi:hypothetical protein
MKFFEIQTTSSNQMNKQADLITALHNNIEKLLHKEIPAGAKSNLITLPAMNDLKKQLDEITLPKQS